MPRVAAVVALALSLATSWAAAEEAAAARQATTGAPAPSEAKPSADAKPALEGKPRVIVYRQDKLTLHVDKVPVREVMDEIARQSGAEVRGEIPAEALATVRFDELALPEAMERLYGRKNYTLGYNDEGRLLRVTLLGPPLAPPDPAGTAQSERGWPFDEHVKRSTDKAWSFIAADTRYPVNGRLAEALGADSVTFRELAIAAARNQDPRVRSLGLRASLNAIRSDPEVRDAFRVAMHDLPDEALARLARQFAQENAEEFVKQIGRRAGNGDLRTRVPPILGHLDGMGPDK